MATPTWTSLANATSADLGATLEKTSGGVDLYNASALTTETLTGSGSFTFTAPVVGVELRVGLGTDASADILQPFSFAFGGTNIVEIRESGVYKSEVSAANGDTFTLEIFNTNQVRYKKNGTTFYTSLATVTLPTQVDVTIKTLNAKITGADIVGAAGGVDTPPTTYSLVSNLTAYELPTLPTMGAAGTTITDPTFYTPITRVTDATTAADGRNWGTPSSPNLSAWNATTTKFYTVDDNAAVYRVFNFTSATGAFTFDRDLTLGVEPCFARVATKPNILYSAQYSNGLKIHKYDFTASTLSEVYDLRTDVPTASNYMTPVYASQASPDWLVCAFGGIQETHSWVTVLQADTPSTRWTFNTRTSQVSQNGGAFTTLLNHAGAPANLNFGIHSISIDRSGVWVKIDVSGNEGGAAHTCWFNTTTGRAHDITADTWYGHYALGFAAHVNCIADAGSDQPQWLFRDLTQGGTLATYRRLIDPTLIPDNAERFADHSSWNNARSDALTPIITGTYRSAEAYTNNDPWLALHDEIAAIPTADGAEDQAYRICHHRSDGDPDVVTFRDSPRPQVSPNGLWTLFTSNWGTTLGTFGPAPKNHRRDLFLVKLAQSGTVPGAAASPSPATTATGVSINPTLSWTAGAGTAQHKVYFGLVNPPVTLASTQFGTTYSPATLLGNTVYYWRVDEVNASGTTTGTVWSFTTTATAGPAGIASIPSPEDDAELRAAPATLSWAAGSGATSYDVYFGATNPPAFVGNQTTLSYVPGTLASGTYYWQINSRSASGTTTGSLWRFVVTRKGKLSAETRTNSSVTHRLTLPSSNSTVD